MTEIFKYITALFLVFLYFNCSASNLNTFYVSTSGNDNNIGAINQPFKSIQGALKKIGELRSFGKLTGDVKIIVKNGEYRLEAPVLITTKEWDGKNLLSIEGENNKLPVLSGGIKLKKFEKINDNLWKIDLTSVIDKNPGIQIQQLYVNSKRALRARTPNLGNFYKTTRTEQKSLPGLGNRVSQVVSLTNEQNAVLNSATSDLGNILVSFNHKWLRTRGYVTGISKQNKYFTFNSIPLSEVISLSAASHFYFENSRSFLDEPGEWVIDKNKILYYIPREGENIQTAIAEVPMLSHIFFISGDSKKYVSNISVKNLSLQITKYIMPQIGETSPQAAAYDENAAFFIRYTNNVTLDNCEIENTSSFAVSIRIGINNKVSNCYMHNLGSGGVRIGEITPPTNNDVTENTAIENNIIHSGGLENPTAPGVIIFHSGNNIISHNEIADFRYSGISVGWVWGYGNSVAKNNKIIFNHIHHLGWSELSDLGGIYTLGPSNGTEIKNNVIHDIYSYDFRGWGIYLDEGSSDILIQNNLVYNCKSAGLHLHYGRNNIVKNNIFANQLNSQLEATRVENHISLIFTNNIVYFNSGKLSGRAGWDIVQFKSDYNLYWDTRTKKILFYNYSFDQWKKQTGKDKNSIIADPLFVNPTSGDFGFKSKENIDKIKFTPFDYVQAGVYGDLEWKAKAKLSSDIVRTYNAEISKRIKEGKLL